MVTRVAIAAGTVIEPEMLTRSGPATEFRRSGSAVVGRGAARTIEANELAEEADLV